MTSPEHPPAPIDHTPARPRHRRRWRPASSYLLSRALFLRGLGLVYLAAFISFWVQAEGLIGSRGILPVRTFLREVRAAYGPRAPWVAPTLCWLNDSDAFLHALCAAGTALAAMLVVGLAPALVLALLYLLYLSLVVAGQDFMGYQWDALLLEAGFLAIFFAPLRRGPALARPPGPSPGVVFLLRWLLFRLMFLSALVKWQGGGAWHNLTALDFHYYTQPLPPWTAWYAHLLPRGLQAASVIGVFVFEGLVPLGYFGPRPPRRVGFWATVAFQGLILLSGNLGFFNLLSIVLCLPLLDDRCFPRRWRARLRARHGARLRAERNVPRRARGLSSRAELRWPRWLIALLAAVLVPLSLIAAQRQLGLFPSADEEAGESAPFQLLFARLYPFQLANGYGLFASMTTRRYEIIIEGSNDGEHWQAYEFKDKPGDVSRRPPYLVPHLPRLDWGMWFAALRQPDDLRPAWYYQFLRRLLEGSPPVLNLLARNPFPAAPPRYVRGVRYLYGFTTPGDGSPPTHWWRRTRLDPYSPPIGLRDGQLYLRDEMLEPAE